MFYFTLTNPEAEDLLKEEISLAYPNVRLSYSRSGFLTFKADKELNFTPVFCRVSGVCLGKFKFEELKFDRAWVWKREDTLQIPRKLQEISDKTNFRPGDKVTLIMMIGPDEFWVGEYVLKTTHFQTPGEVSSILETDAPSRAYYKIAEATEAFDLPFENEEKILELGSAPGGATQFLLENDLKVYGVDPADMDPKIVKNVNFRHYRMPFEHITKDTFKQDIDWIISDVNLPPTVVMKEIVRLHEFMEPRGLVLTLKINDAKHLRILWDFIDTVSELGYERYALKYLPSHRQEVCLVALRFGS
ncbi:MAG: SAM-dependent methyltransferase [Bacteriovoracaceae bacterium]